MTGRQRDGCAERDLSARGRSIRSVVREAEIDEDTLRNVPAGSSWPDLRTITCPERALRCALLEPPNLGSAEGQTDPSDGREGEGQAWMPVPRRLRSSETKRWRRADHQGRVLRRRAAAT